MKILFDEGEIKKIELGSSGENKLFHFLAPYIERAGVSWRMWGGKKVKTTVVLGKLK